MKKVIIKILLLFFFGLCSVSTSQTKAGYDFHFQVNKNLPEYGFNIEEINKENDNNDYLIRIYQSDSDSLIQTIRMDFPDVAPYIDSLIDVNFDGYKDLCFIMGLGENGKNQCYAVYLFNTVDKKFHINDGFSSIINLSVNDSLKQIYEHYFTGCLDCSDIKTYIVKENTLVLIEVDSQFWDANKMPVRFIEKYKDGKLVSSEEVEPRQ